jgi:hypothetical protein
MKTFEAFLDEIYYKGNGRLNQERKIPTVVVDNVVYKGKKYILFKEKEYFILTNTNKQTLFYIAYEEGRSRKIVISTRENVSKEKNLFFKVIYTLLYKGYQITEDYLHNDLSINSIKRLITSNVVQVMYDGKDINQELIDNDFNDNKINSTFTYRLVNFDNQYLIEKRHMSMENDFFNIADFFILNTNKEL